MVLVEDDTEVWAAIAGMLRYAGHEEPSVPLERLLAICWGRSDISAGQSQ
jgi:hypothetical protein